MKFIWDATVIWTDGNTVICAVQSNIRVGHINCLCSDNKSINTHSINILKCANCKQAFDLKIIKKARFLNKLRSK